MYREVLISHRTDAIFILLVVGNYGKLLDGHYGVNSYHL